MSGTRPLPPMGGQSASRRLVWRGRRQAARLGGAGAGEATDKASVMSAYGTTRWRKLRVSFRRDCELRQLPCGIWPAGRRVRSGYAAELLKRSGDQQIQRHDLRFHRDTNTAKRGLGPGTSLRSTTTCKPTNALTWRFGRARAVFAAGSSLDDATRAAITPPIAARVVSSLSGHMCPYTSSVVLAEL